jgi:hypothetical protein
LEGPSPNLRPCGPSDGETGHVLQKRTCFRSGSPWTPGGCNVTPRSPEGCQLTVRLPSPPAFAAGGQRIVSIRPERLSVSQMPPAANAVRAQVAEKTFPGSAFRIVLETESKRRLTAPSSDSGAAEAAQAGHVVYCGFDPADAVPLDTRSK